MTKTTDLACAALKRLARHLKAKPRMVFSMRFQECEAIDVYGDTDWAGCLRTRNSTMGGCVMLGFHMTKAWPATQASLALSSGEAEFYGVVKGSGIGLGQAALFADIGIQVPLRVWTDSSAAIGICGRQGLGKLRHVACQTLWVQQRVRRGDFELRKVKGEVNPADLFTKHLESQSKPDSLLKIFGCELRGGRPAAAPELQQEVVIGLCEAFSVDLDSGVPTHDTTLLPHQLSLEDIERHFPKARPVPAPLGEADSEVDPYCVDPAER